MTRPSVRHTRWADHVNHVNPPSHLRTWLTDTASLTVKLIAHCKQFRVQRLHQRIAFCLADECKSVKLPRRMQVREREVLLHCDNRPVVFAHTIVPLQSTAADWPFFGALGERSLGSTLFGDPKVERSHLQFARLHVHHPLACRTYAALSAAAIDFPLFARRCLYRRKNGMLLVTEVFLPSVVHLHRSNNLHAK